MAYHPLNLALRFMLEVVGLAAFAYWGWAWGGNWRWPLAIGLPLIAMFFWGGFRFADPSGLEGNGFMEISGPLRLALEFAFLGLAVAALLTAHANDRAKTFAIIFAVVIVIHYIISYDRVLKMLGLGG